MFSETSVLFYLFGLPVIAFAIGVAMCIYVRRAWVRRHINGARTSLVVAIIAIVLAAALVAVCGALLLEVAGMYVWSVKQHL